MIKRMSIIEGHSVEDILHSISDGKSLDLFRSIAKGSVESEVLKETKGLFEETVLHTHQPIIAGRTDPEEIKAAFHSQVWELLYIMHSS